MGWTKTGDLNLTGGEASQPSRNWAILMFLSVPAFLLTVASSSTLFAWYFGFHAGLEGPYGVGDFTPTDPDLRGAFLMVAAVTLLSGIAAPLAPLLGHFRKERKMLWGFSLVLVPSAFISVSYGLEYQSSPHSILYWAVDLSQHAAFLPALIAAVSYIVVSSSLAIAGLFVLTTPRPPDRETLGSAKFYDGEHYTHVPLGDRTDETPTIELNGTSKKAWDITDPRHVHPKLGHHFGLPIGVKDGQMLYDRTGSHTCVFAPTGAGKGVSLVIPTLLCYPGSMVVFDIKGELYWTTSNHRLRMGQKVIRLDPFGPRSSCFNPLDTVIYREDPRAMVDDVSVLSRQIVPPPVSSTGNTFFADTARNLLSAIILYVCHQYQRGSNNRTFDKVRFFLKKGDSDLQKWLKEESNNDGNHKFLQRQLGAFVGMADRTWTGVAAEAKRCTEFFDSLAISRVTGRTDVDFTELKTGFVTVYVVMPPDKLQTYRSWVRLMIYSAQKTCRSVDTVMEYPVQFLIDELPRLGRLDLIDEGVSLDRGYGIAWTFIVQSVAQLRAEFGKDSSINLVSNATQRMAWANDNPEEAKLVSQYAGQTTIQTVSESHGISRRKGGGSGLSRSDNESHSQKSRDLISPHEVRTLPDHLAFVMPRHKGMLVVERSDIRKHQFLNKRVGPHPQYQPDQLEESRQERLAYGISEPPYSEFKRFVPGRRGEPIRLENRLLKVNSKGWPIDADCYPLPTNEAGYFISASRPTAKEYGRDVVNPNLVLCSLRHAHARSNDEARALEKQAASMPLFLPPDSPDCDAPPARDMAECIDLRSRLIEARTADDAHASFGQRLTKSLPGTHAVNSPPPEQPPPKKDKAHREKEEGKPSIWDRVLSFIPMPKDRPFGLNALSFGFLSHLPFISLTSREESVAEGQNPLFSDDGREPSFHSREDGQPPTDSRSSVPAPLSSDGHTSGDGHSESMPPSSDSLPPFVIDTRPVGRVKTGTDSLETGDPDVSTRSIRRITAPGSTEAGPTEARSAESRSTESRSTESRSSESQSTSDSTSDTHAPESAADGQGHRPSDDKRRLALFDARPSFDKVGIALKVGDQLTLEHLLEVVRDHGYEQQQATDGEAKEYDGTFLRRSSGLTVFTFGSAVHVDVSGQRIASVLVSEISGGDLITYDGFHLYPHDSPAADATAGDHVDSDSFAANNSHNGAASGRQRNPKEEPSQEQPSTSKGETRDSSKPISQNDMDTLAEIQKDATTSPDDSPEAKEVQFQHAESLKTAQADTTFNSHRPSEALMKTDTAETVEATENGSSPSPPQPQPSKDPGGGNANGDNRTQDTAPKPQDIDPNVQDTDSNPSDTDAKPPDTQTPSSDTEPPPSDTQGNMM